MSGIPASRVELQIDELILHGVAPRDQETVAGAFTRELTRLFTEQGLPEALSAAGQVGSLDAGVLDAKPGLAPEHLGTQAARAVYTSLGGKP